MGSGIAQIAAQAGASVVVFDVADKALARSREVIFASFDDLVKRGKLDGTASQSAKARLRWVKNLAELADCQLVIEAIIEDADIKGQLFKRLEAVVSSDAIIATNTSSLPISRLACDLEHPGRFIGMHFFNPVAQMKLVEVVVGAGTAPEVSIRIMAVASDWGKVAIAAQDVPGFIVNRVARPYYAEGFKALAEGAASADAIDTLFRSAGFRMGPLELSDLIGQDINFAAACSIFDGYFGRTRFAPQLRQARLVDAGWLGRKTGRGVYTYPGGPQPMTGEGAGAEPTPARQAAAAALAGAPAAWTHCEGVVVGQTRGATAKAESRRHGKPVILFDWLGQNDGLIGFSASEAQAVMIAHGVAAAWGRPSLRLSDRPGLIVARALAQIANAAADAVLEQVANEAAIDMALRFGANYPVGPMTWADGFGRKALVVLLDGIAAETGEGIYRASHYLRATA